MAVEIQAANNVGMATAVAKLTDEAIIEITNLCKLYLTEPKIESAFTHYSVGELVTTVLTSVVGNVLFILDEGRTGDALRLAERIGSHIPTFVTEAIQAMDANKISTEQLQPKEKDDEAS